jgi:hypothetical protein
MKLKEFFDKQVPVRAERLDLDAVEKSRLAFVAALEPREHLRSELRAQLADPDAEMPETGIEREHRLRILSDVAVLETGDWERGNWDSRLTPFVGGPGIDHLTYWIRQCEEAMAAERARRAVTWPAPFRFVGRPGTHSHDGRKLRRGDVVLLSRSQAEAWADKFEPVGDEQPATT